MIFQTHIPNFPLDRFVDFFIYYESYNPAHSVDRFLPDGNVEILIDLHDRPQYIYDNDSLKEIQACHRVWASGLRTEPITIPSGKDSAMMVISFKKGMAAPFFPFPMNEIVDCVVDADLIWGETFVFLREAILETAEISKKFEIAERFLVENFVKKISVNPCVEYAVSEIVSRADQVSLRRLTERIGYSQKHFISMFRSQVGVTPKSFLKIIRFQNAINEIESNRIIDWTSISHDCGFYDQAHFINDFRSFSGFTPEQYSKRRGVFLNYIPIG